jgi:hypothetical protein
MGRRVADAPDDLLASRLLVMIVPAVEEMSL